MIQKGWCKKALSCTPISRSFALCNIVVHCNLFYSMLMEVQTGSVSIEALCISTSNELAAKRLHTSLTNTVPQYMHSKQIGNRVKITDWTQSKSK
ncbi:hypothetical protein H5410_016907 [Solanum commersonii]|uniref:Uncharacterized protein n=1 Tax=Solanum commersonii TaxID=4109 RepID=A0A9J5ZYD6_SOLCO|nr:hypothetical protein H5410_016907 [Solanum commersonii]